MSLDTLREAARALREAALAAADPGRAVTAVLARSGDGLLVGGVPYPVRGSLSVVAAGKASAGMAEAALAAAGPLVSRALLVLPHGYAGLRLPALSPAGPEVEVLRAGHPVPDQGSVTAALQAGRLVEGMAGEDTCLLLLSGGGSSLLSLPLAPLSLEDLVETGRLLLASGADIHEVNTVRRHLGAIAGGRLAEGCRGTILTLAVSDVIGDELHAIASGPTVPAPTTWADAAAVLDRHGLARRVPPAVQELIRRAAAAAVPETPKHLPARHHAQVIASGRIAVDAIVSAARSRGFAPRVLTTALAGEAREAGRMLARAGLDALAAGRGLPACLIAAGETTVTVQGPGRGGRNQEVALAAALELSGTGGILLMSFATDGREGNTDAAGAYADGRTIAAGRAAGLDAETCLAANDSHAFLEAAGELIVTGPTGTNVNDLTLVLVEKDG